jgi:hypothetical protein
MELHTVAGQLLLVTITRLMLIRLVITSPPVDHLAVDTGVISLLS